MTPSLDLAACTVTGWQATPDLGLRAVVTAGLLLIAGWAGAQRYFAGQRAFVLLLLVMVAWIGATTAEHAAVEAGCKSSMALLAWPVILVQPPLWTLFLHQYVQSETRLPGRGVLVMALLPTALLALAALGNGAHGLFYGPATALGPAIAGLPRMRYDYGPLFVVAAAWGYVWLAAASLLVLRAWRRAARADRGQWLAFLVMMAVPWAANVAYLGLGLRLLGGDPTPLTFAIAVVGFAWLIRNDSLFKVVPLARRLLFTDLPDPVLVLDPVGRVMDVNAAAAALAGALPRGAQPLALWPRFGAPLAALLAGPPATRTPAPMPLVLTDPEAVYEVRVREVGEPEHRVGRLVQLRDVTERHQAQARLVQTLAERDAQLAQVAALQNELREQALRDPLTGLHNRRALNQHFAREAAAQQATARPLALVLLDLDHFKRINDHFGHAVGDAVLCQMAARLDQSLRQGERGGDAVFRVGGEEFALLLPGADAAQAAQHLALVRDALAAQPLPGAPEPVTFSAGVAESGRDGSTLDALLRAADRALYQAKAAGRDGIVIAGRAPP
jgi:diguanylate cyclase (GGDEF)-like protein